MKQFIESINNQIAILNQVKDIFQRNEELLSITVKHSSEYDDGESLLFLNELNLKCRSNGLEFNFDSEDIDFQCDDLKDYLENELGSEWILPLSKEDYESLLENTEAMIRFSTDGEEGEFTLHRNNFYYNGEYKLDCVFSI